MKKPIYQICIDYLQWILVGFLAVGGFFGVINDAVTFITPSIRNVATLSVLLIWGMIEIFIKYKPIPWTQNGVKTNIKKIGPQIRLPILGIIILLWTPYIIEMTPSVIAWYNIHTSSLSERIENLPQEDRIVILVTEFEDAGSLKYDVSNRIYETLEKNFGGTRFPDVLIRYLPTTISRTQISADPSVLSTLGRKQNASIIIWGFYDDAGFSPAFNLVKTSGPIEIKPDSIISVGKINLDSSGLGLTNIDTEIARELDLYESENGTLSVPENTEAWGYIMMDGLGMVVGPQKRLAEQPTDQDIQKYIRDSLPRQMTFLSAVSLSFYLDDSYKLETLDLAIEAGEEIIQQDFLASLNYWRVLLAKTYSRRGNIELANQIDKRQVVSEYVNKAFADYKRAIDLKPDFALAYFYRGRARYAIHNLEGAMADLKKVLELSDDPTLRNSAEEGLKMIGEK